MGILEAKGYAIPCTQEFRVQLRQHCYKPLADVKIQRPGIVNDCEQHTCLLVSRA